MKTTISEFKEKYPKLIYSFEKETGKYAVWRNKITGNFIRWCHQKKRYKIWKLQKGRDLLTGIKLEYSIKPAYHHIDYNKSNDKSDNGCWLLGNTHMLITGCYPNPIKREYYKKILQDNIKTLKEGKIPKTWSSKNKDYIIVLERIMREQKRIRQYKINTEV